MLLGETEVQTDGFGMANVQVAIRFRGKTGMYLFVFASRQVILYDLFQEIQ